MKKICVFTGTRAEYGLLKPLMDGILRDESLHLQILVTGMHLSAEFGLTYQCVEKDGFSIDEKVEILLSSDTAVGVSKAMGLGLIGFADALTRLCPDLAVILGDRFECMAFACACLNARIPIAHIHGGETTVGAVDEAFRHAITKMSHLHFTSTDVYRKRVIQLGEDPGRVFDVGAIGIENIRNMELLSREALGKKIGFDLPGRYLLVTFHPVTLESATAGDQFKNLLFALDKLVDLPGDPCKIIFTRANADADGRVINQLIEDYVSRHPEKTIVFTSMGQREYLSAMQYASAVVGNSSSGIIEAPSFGVPTVNIGDRQKGRVRDRSVIDCEPFGASIVSALEKALSDDFVTSLQGIISKYEKRGTTEAILKILRNTEHDIIIKKEFYDG